MRRNLKYVVAVALLAVLAVVFGLAGTVAPAPELVSPQQSSSSSSSSDSVTHFMNPPTYDSGWVNITTKAGQYFTLKHDLNTTEVVVDITGKQSLDPMSGALAWNRTYGGANYEFAESVVETSDGGYAIVGPTMSFGAGNYDFWLVKTDSFGNAQWNKTYGGAYGDFARSIVETSDGGYALAGSTGSFGAGQSDFWLVKVDSSGNMQWNKTYGGAGLDYGDVSVVETSDGGYALAGETSSFGAGKSDFWLVKTDSFGNAQWNKTYGGADWEIAESVVETSDGGYALTGFTMSFGAGNYDFWLVKTDVDGNMQWNKTYGGANDDRAYSVVETSDDGYALAGNTGSHPIYDFWLVKTDSAGNVQWNQTYGGAENDEAHSVVETPDKGYAIAGYTGSPALYDFWLVKTDSAGNVQWNQTYGGSSSDTASSVVETSDGGYALAGLTYSFDAGGGDFWLVKVNVEMDLEHQRNLGDSQTGLAWTGLTNHTIILYRGETDTYWNLVRVRIWLIQEPTWQYGDINQDGVVDIQDLYILSQNYGKTFSLLSLTGIAFIAGIHQYKKRKQQK